MSEEEKKEFEQSLDNSPEIQEAFKDFLTSKRLGYEMGRLDQKKAFHTLSEAQQEQPKSRRLWLGISAAAAVIIILLALITLIPQLSQPTPSDIFAEQFSLPEVPTEMGKLEDSLIKKANVAFENGDYQQAISLFEQVNQDNISSFLQSQIALLSGVSYLKLNEGDQARNSLERANQHTEMADWYLALSWLGENQVENAQQAFQKIATTKGHFYQDKAKKILDML